MKGSAEGGNNYGDWLSLYNPSTPIEFIDLAYHAYDSALMAEMARALAKNDHAAYYHDRNKKLTAQFQKLHLGENSTINPANQSTYAMALFFDLIPADEREAAAAHLAQLIRDNDNKMTTGFLGTRPLLPVLSEHGQHELAGILMQQKEYPSWGYEVENGATTIWERWNSYIEGEGVHSPDMNSFSHYAFGAVSEWMFAELGGIELLSPGYDVFRLAPRPTGTLTHCTVETECRHGAIKSAWKLNGDQFQANFTIPPNTTAVVTLPIVGQEGEPKHLESGSYQFAGEYQK
jgi:alpha-L-rhamnosidase